MNKYLFFPLIVVAALFLSCKEEDTYAELLERERDQINAFLQKGCTVWYKDAGEPTLKVDKINVISESQFYAQGSTTNVANNEYVLFSSTGLYMQIVRQGTGEVLQEGTSKTVLMRYYEYNIAGDSLQSTNITQANNSDLSADIMVAQNNYGTISASFTAGLMMQYYGSAAVPSGWIHPLKFIKLGRQSTPDDEIALVRLIVPSSQGQMNASSNVYPCFYEITYQEGR